MARTCTFAGCPYAHHARGYCKRHYNQMRYERPMRALPQEYVPNGPLRDAYLRRSTDITQADVARALGWLRPGNRASADITRLKRMLGLAPSISRHGGKRYVVRQTTMTYENAVRLVFALGLDPVRYEV